MGKKNSKSLDDAPGPDGDFSNLEQQVRETLVTWTSKSDELKTKSLDEIYALYLTVLQVEQRMYPTKPEVDLHKRAMRKFKLQYKQKKVGGGSITCTGIFWGYKGAIDQVRKRRADALREAKLNPLAAAKKNLIKTREVVENGVKKLVVEKDKEGNYIPIDDRKYYIGFRDESGNQVLNPRFGKELPEHQWSSIWFGMFSVNGEDPEIGFFQIRGADGEKGLVKIPMNVPVKFHAFGMEKDRGTGLMLINGFKTKFEPIQASTPSLYAAYNAGFLTQYMRTLSEMPEFFASNKNNFNGFFVSAVNVLKKVEEKSSNGTYRVVVDDESLEYDDPDGNIKYTELTGFIPDCFENEYSLFGELSRLIIIASCRIDFKTDNTGKYVYDSDNNKILGDPILSIWGFDLDPEFIEKPREVAAISGNEFSQDSRVLASMSRNREELEIGNLSKPAIIDDTEDIDVDNEKPVLVEDDSDDESDEMDDISKMIDEDL